MMRFAVRVAFGLIVTLSMPSFAAAQLLPGVSSARDLQPGRAFSRISFEARTPATGPVSRPAGAMETEFGMGVRLPEVTSAPEPHGTTVPCVMRIFPVDPRVLKSKTPIVVVNKRADPKSVITIPTCQPRD